MSRALKLLLVAGLFLVGPTPSPSGPGAGPTKTADALFGHRVIDGYLLTATLTPLGLKVLAALDAEGVTVIAAERPSAGGGR